MVINYNNVLVSTATPKINQNISAEGTHFITITYDIPVVLSNGTITVFQNDGSSSGIIRQITNGLENGNYVNLVGNTVNVTVISSTFNNPGATYYVIIGNGFVMSQLYNEPLLGLNNNVWTFSTSKLFTNFSREK